MSGIPERVRQAEAAFFVAWRDAVQLAGVRFFGDGTQKGFAEAESKNALQPRIEDIEGALPGMSPGERVFLVAMVSLYNTLAGRRLAAKHELHADLMDLTRLDRERRQVISMLLVSYAGW